MQRPLLSSPGCHLVEQGARRERAHPPAAAGVTISAHQLRAEQARVRGGAVHMGAWVAAVLSKSESWTDVTPSGWKPALS